MKKSYLFDTNSLLDILLLRKGKSESETIITQAQKDLVDVHIPNIVFFEIEWVLRSVYKRERTYIADFLSSLLAIDGLLTENKTLLIQSLRLYSKHSTIGLVDALLVAQALACNSSLITRDKKLLSLYKTLSK
ncbi:PIN domain-containing protein [Candidatus Gottesmanbacteria bacterium]|nr:PIN domain-containing protein [Candidatus Gottesmanbacteria bacterium]